MKRPSQARNERGAALPLAILVIAMMSLAAIASIQRLSAERHVNANLEAESDAYALAVAGLTRFAAFSYVAPAASLDTTLTGFPGGNVAISVRRIRVANDSQPALYIIRALATHTGSARYNEKTPSAQRSVAQFAAWVEGSMEVKSSWTSITGLKKNGGSGVISGHDQCGVQPSEAGVSVPVTAADGNTGYDQNGGASVPEGDPDIEYLGNTPAEMAQLITIDWDGAINGGVFTPTYMLTSTTGWPTDFTDWPSILVTTSSLSLNSTNSGRGLLVVTGDLILQGTFSWDGVILVGGVMTSTGNNTILGSITSGLNVKLGATVGVSDLGNGVKTFRYNSCNVLEALQDLGSLKLLGNTRIDNWPSY